MNQKVIRIANTEDGPIIFYIDKFPIINIIYHDVQQYNTDRSITTIPLSGWDINKSRPLTDEEKLELL